MLNKDQTQDASNGSIAIQSGRDAQIINIGLTADEARNIALDVAKATFFDLAGVARELASSRVEEITDKVINKLEKEYPNGLFKAQDPDFQYALLTVQKQYARNGDTNLGDLLVDLLVDRSKSDSRDIMQIVLNESLETAPKLTDSQLANLATIFLLRYADYNGVVNLAALGDFFDKYLTPFSSKITASQASFQHMEFAGCGAIQITDRSLEKMLLSSYGGLFMAGFDGSVLEDKVLPKDLLPVFFIACLNDPQKIQVKAKNLTVLKQLFVIHSVDQEHSQIITELYNTNMLSEEAIRDKCIELRPYMDNVFNIWNNSSMKSFTLTSVGIAIGHANAKRYLGEFTDLSVWIN